MPRKIDIKAHCQSLIAKHGSTRKAGAALGVDSTCLHRIATGAYTEPTDDTLHKLGLRVVRELKFFKL